jgi:hypothetical protein
VNVIFPEASSTALAAPLVITTFRFVSAAAFVSSLRYLPRSSATGVASPRVLSTRNAPGS